MRIFPLQKQFRFKAVRWTIALVGSGLVFSGCGKSKTPSTPSPSVENKTSASVVANTPELPVATDTAPADQPVAATPSHQPLTTANGTPDLGELNRTMIRWIVRNRRAPANFAEFSATAGIPIPPPPAGQKYIIGNDKHVLLVPQ
jgi:hypothetical protein